ncbi:MAG: biopolymer transporter ExbD [Pseudomonadota bacterium]
MALKARKPRKRASITSLIDVIFLLLLFFMLSSTFSRFSEIEITTAESSAEGTSGSSEQTGLVVQTVGVRLGEESVVDDDLVVRLSSLRMSGATALTVTPADDVVTQRLIDVLVLTARVPGLEIYVSDPES